MNTEVVKFDSCTVDASDISEFDDETQKWCSAKNPS